MADTPPRREELLTVDRAFQVAWIVYINGIEVPVQAVSVSYGVWQIPEAEVTMVPDVILQRLGAEDRVAVQIFYCDYWQNPSNPEFRLMFDGEIVGWSYVNVQKGRALSFSCIDYVQIFTQLFFFFMSNVDDIAAGVSNREIGVTINGVNTPGFGAIYPYSLFAQGLTGEGSPTTASPGVNSESSNSSESAPLINKPIDFVYNIVRALVSKDAPNKSVPASNFFSPWAKRTKFHRRFVALPFLEDAADPGIFPILRAVRADFAVSAVARLASNVGSAGSMWEMVQQILQTLMMELVMLPTATVVEGRFNTLQSHGAPITPSGAKPVILTNYFVKPQFLFGIPPTCNVFFPSQIEHFAYEENYITQPTRMYFNDEAITSYLNVNANVSPGLSTLLRDALAVAHPEEVNIAARSAVNTPGENGKNMLVYPEEFYKGPVVDRRPMPKWFLFLKTAQQQTRPPADNNPPPTTSTEQVARDVAPGDDERNVYRLYAKYEYFKERYSRRSGGLHTAFNPYPVPGFPCAVFDRRSTKIDVFGYVMNVRQTMTSKGWSTQTAFSYGRTFQEMFALMNRQFSMENETIRLRAADTRDAINAGEQSRRFSGRAEAVGVIGTAPPEPLREIRDIIQNFQRAEAFYRALFFRVPAPEADELSQQQLRAEADRRAGPEGPPLHQAVVTPALPTAGLNPEQARQDLRRKRAAFFYSELVDLVSSEGTAEPIRIGGVDATARLRLLETITKMRSGTAVNADLSFIRESINRPQLRQQSAGKPEDPAVTAELNSIEEAVRGVTVQTNIRGDREVIPKQEAEMLFQSYEAAMRYCSRPICTLDEYLMFLGEDAAPSGVTHPGKAARLEDSRYFPAKFYARIREYVSGPPDTVPSTDFTNTQGVTNTDGTTTTPPVPPEAQTATVTAEGATTRSSTVQPLPEDFPDNRADWNTILLAYRANILSVLPPRN